VAAARARRERGRKDDVHDDAPDYGNWVSQKLIAWNAAIAVLFVALSWLASAFLVAAGLFMPVCAYFAYARFKFSRRGGDLQARIRRLVVDHIDWDGQGSALDIGCGNGPLVIALAEQFPPAHVTGIDLWGGAWEYSKARCERNARVGGVSERVSFQ
jgi:SAM-dependent methyltransferase